MSNLEQLKTLLLAPEQDHLADLDTRVDELEKNAQELANQLPDAVHAMSDDPRFLASLDKPISDTINQTIRRDVHSFAEVLFPVMGPAIRRAVADAMKNLVQRVNLVLEQKFSIQSIRWRLESARTGVPVAQIVLDKTMLFSVQEAFLIDPHTGLILGRAIRNHVLALDEDAVSSMLVAIQSFIRDSFGGDENEELRGAEVGDRTLWVINGPEAVLACIISGSPARELRDVLLERLESIHYHHAGRFETLLKSRRDDPAINADLQACLLEQLQHPKKNHRRSNILFVLIALAILVAIFLTIQRTNSREQLRQDVFHTLDQQPGIIVTDVQWASGGLKVAGLKDPKADDPNTILTESALDSVPVSFELHPYYALEPALIMRRLGKQLALPADFEMSLQGDVLKVNSPVSADEAQTFTASLLNHPLIDRVEFNQVLQPPLTLEQRVHEIIGAGDDVIVSVENGQIILDGLAPHAWITDGRQIHTEVEGRAVSWHGIWPIELATVEAQADIIGQSHIQFISELIQAGNVQQELIGITAALQKINRAALEAGIPLTTSVIGMTDSVGGVAYNINLRRQRAEHVVWQLIALEVNPNTLAVSTSDLNDPEGGYSLEFRRVYFQIQY